MTMSTNDRATVRLAAVGDIHFGRTPVAALQALLSRIVETADILVLAGDLTDTGHPDEARLLAKELATVKLPIVAVLGNHDHHAGRVAETQQILTDAGVSVLDGTAVEVLGVGFAGTKGFAGGFGRHALGPWGEQTIKGFVQEAVDEALKLETALARIRSDRRVALLHYAPIAGTVMGEPPEIFAYLGSSRLEEPLGRYRVDVVYHGHAHHGAPEGATAGGVPVYNVSMSLLQRTFPEQAAFRLFEMPRSGAPASPSAGDPLPARNA